MTEERRMPIALKVVGRAEPAADDGTRWLALVLAEMLRTGLALIAKRYPEARGKVECPRCGFRHG